MLNQNGVVEGSGSEGLLRVRDAADFLAVSERTVWRMIALGELKTARVRRCLRIYRASLEQYLKAQNQVGCV